MVIGLKIVGLILLFTFSLYFGTLGNHSLSMVICLSLMAGFVGYRLPDAVIISKIRKRQQEIAMGLPDALDLLVITVEAGLGLNAALLRVGQDLRTGIPREEALRNLGDRNRVEDLRIFVGSVIMADRLGTSITDTLRSQADSLRTRIRQKAQEKAAKAGIKMLIPLILFILPALISILMGPGLIAVVRTLSQ